MVSFSYFTNTSSIAEVKSNSDLMDYILFHDTGFSYVYKIRCFTFAFVSEIENQTINLGKILCKIVRFSCWEAKFVTIMQGYTQEGRQIYYIFIKCSIIMIIN